jgi:hypothetical protein
MCRKLAHCNSYSFASNPSQSPLILSFTHYLRLAAGGGCPRMALMTFHISVMSSSLRKPSQRVWVPGSPSPFLARKPPSTATIRMASRKAGGFSAGVGFLVTKVRACHGISVTIRRLALVELFANLEVSQTAQLTPRLGMRLVIYLHKPVDANMGVLLGGGE